MPCMELVGVEGLASFEKEASSLFAPLRIQPKDPSGFQVALTRAHLDEIVVSAIRGPASRVVRDDSRTTSTDRHLVKALIQVNGYASVEQDGRRRIARPGSLFLCDTTRPYELSYPDSYSTVVVGVPVSRLRCPPSRLRDALATPCASDLGLGRLVTGFLRDLAAGVGNDTLDGAHVHLGHAVTALVNAALDAAPWTVDGQSPDFVDYVLAVCETNLGDPDLTVAAVARRCGVSVRYLQKACAAREISLGHWIRDRRLDHVAGELRESRSAGRSIAAVAAGWGMLDCDHLSRAFRERFGVTPREYRRSAVV